MAAGGMEFQLGEYEGAVRDGVEALAGDGFVPRLWERDATLWVQEAEEREAVRNSLGWLDVAEKMEERLGELEDFRREVTGAGFGHVVYMGMGGSSLCPLVFERSFSPGDGGLPLTVLDSTDPATVLAVERRVPAGRTLFIAASKSGTTVETSAFGEYFYSRLQAGEGDAGGAMAVVTDPGTPLARLAAERGYRRTWLNFPDIGGRFSALSYFGMVPAALMGLDVAGMLERAVRMAERCRAPEADNPAVLLGAAMGELARLGRDKVTLVMPAPLADFGAWLEQLLAESTGKDGTGLVPVAGERLGAPEVYGGDRLFIRLRLTGEDDGETEARLAELAAAGQPLVTIDMEDTLDLGGEFFRWEAAVAVAGAVLGIDPFDQPNVQESKENTRRLLEAGDGQGLGAGGAALDREEWKRFLAEVEDGDYVALLAYLTENGETDALLDELRLRIRDELGVAVTVAYGPRYLHSTGQLHKGGPGSGAFLVLTADAPADVPVPGAGYGFAALREAQARGDIEALAAHGRRVLHVHLGEDIAAGLKALAAAAG